MAIFRIFFSRVLLLLILYRTSTAVSECNRAFGASIVPADCYTAIRLFNLIAIRDTGNARPVTHVLFSRDPSIAGGLRQMRQTFTYGTCAMGIDFVDPLPPSGSALSCWLDFRNHMELLIRKCIPQPGAIGGVSKFGSFEVTLANPNDQAVREVVQMPKPREISFSESIKTHHLDLQLKADGEAPTGPPSPPRAESYAHPGLLRSPPAPVQNRAQARIHRPDPRGYIFSHGSGIAHGPALTPSQETHLTQWPNHLQSQGGFSAGQAPTSARGQPQGPVQAHLGPGGRPYPQM